MLAEIFFLLVATFFIILSCANKTKVLGASGTLLVAGGVFMLLTSSLVWSEGLTFWNVQDESVINTLDANGNITASVTDYNFLSVNANSGSGFWMLVQIMFWMSWVVIIIGIRRLYDNFLNPKARV